MSSVLPDTGADCHTAAPADNITPAGMTPTVRAIRDLLSEAGEARRRGDSAVADALERDAALVLRAAIQDARAEARYA